MKALDIKKVVVLGAGTMGAQVAAHLVACGCDVALLDIVPPGATDRSARIGPLSSRSTAASSECLRTAATQSPRTPGSSTGRASQIPSRASVPVWRSARRATCRPVTAPRCGTRAPADVYGTLK